MATKRIAGWHQDMAKKLKGMIANRDTYDEITNFGNRGRLVFDPVTGKYGYTGNYVEASSILDFFRPCLVEERCDFDKHKRGDAVNHDLYAYSPSSRLATPSGIARAVT
jgi:hypothetical protein